MEPKHTPGPWYARWDEGEEGSDLRVWGSHVKDPENRRRVVADVEWAEGTHLAETEANAALIAAAPEMAMALRAVLAWEDDESIGLPNHTWDAIRAALKKAGALK